MITFAREGILDIPFSLIVKLSFLEMVNMVLIRVRTDFFIVSINTRIYFNGDRESHLDAKLNVEKHVSILMPIQKFINCLLCR